MNEEKSKHRRFPKAGGDRLLRRRDDAAAAAKRPGEKGRIAPRPKRQDADKNPGAKPRFEMKRPAKPKRQEAVKAAAPQGKGHAGERVAKVMARAGACSRRDAEQWIVEGRVAVNGRALTSPAFNVREGDSITIDGKPLAERERTRLFLFHKPAGLVTSAKDPEGRETVFQYIAERRPELPRLVSIGRLDINTEGLLLLSNDGALARVLELPATGWTRRYRVRAHGEVDQAMLDALAKGVTVDDITYAPIDARLDRIQGANAWITMGLREGKNREIKRVLEHLRLDVTRLIRVSFGPFQLGDLAEGAIEEVRLKTLREQLGTGLAELAGVDFSSPLREAPSATERETARVAAQNRPRRHVSELRRQRAEKADEKAPRARIERAVTADRKGRAVAVERVVVKKAGGVAQNRNARRFEALRRDSENEGAALSGPSAVRRGRGAPAFERAREKGYDRPREDRSFGSIARDRGEKEPRGEERRRPRREEPVFRREGGAKFDRSRKPREDRSFGSPRETRNAASRAAERPGRDLKSPFESETRKNFARPRKPPEGASQPRFKRDGGKGSEGPRGERRSGSRSQERPAYSGKAAPFRGDEAKGPRRSGGGKGKPPTRPRSGSR